MRPRSTPAPPETPGKRLTLSEVVRLMLTRGATDRSYVQLTRNAKGDTQVDVKVGLSEGSEVETLEAAEAQARAIYDRLTADYRAPEPAHQGVVELTRNAKGETQVEVQLRTGDTPAEPDTVEEAARLAADAYDTLRRRYPMADGRTGRPGSVAEGEGGT